MRQTSPIATVKTHNGRFPHDWQDAVFFEGSHIAAYHNKPNRQNLDGFWLSERMTLERVLPHVASEDIGCLNGDTLGTRCDRTPPTGLRCRQAVPRHYAMLLGDGQVQREDAAVALLIEKIESAPEAIAGEIEAACAVPGVWVDEVARLAQSFLHRAAV